MLAVARGEPRIAPALASRMLTDLGRGAAPVDDPVARLSDREREVLALLAEGLRNREIAERLVVSEPTVKRTCGTSWRSCGSATGPRRRRSPRATSIDQRAQAAGHRRAHLVGLDREHGGDAGRRGTGQSRERDHLALLARIGANASWGEVRTASSTARSASTPLSPPGSARSTRSVTSSATPASLEAAIAAP